MLEYLLKFSACLAIFMVFYKLFLERENMHHIKRYYLLAALLLSLCIPLVTFTEYVEPTITESFVQSIDNFESTTQTEELVVPTNYTPIVLWSVYCLGLLIFGIKFSLNLVQIYKKIKRNPKYKSHSFVNVLLTDLITPHTFFSYIFLNKQKYEAKEIPKEVFIHEQTHAKQKHSVDVIFIELLQVVFWFNPLIYLIKKDIKLNHEFLADQAVLQNGIEPSEYQSLLLAFSSNAQQVELANAINYSSIKKRFTVMKTHTSKQKKWLRNLMLLPLIAITLYGFSQKKEVVKQSLSTAQSNNHKLESIPILEISVNADVFKLNGKKTSLSQLKEDFSKATNNDESDLRIKTVGGIKMSLINAIMDELKGNLKQIRLDEAAYIIGDTTSEDYQQNVTKEELDWYNSIIKDVNSNPEDKRIFKQKDANKLESIYIRMSSKQKAEAEPFPKFVDFSKIQKASPEEVEEYNKLAKHINGQIETKSFIVKTKDVKRLEELYAKMSNEQKKTSEHYPDFSKFPPPPQPLIVPSGKKQNLPTQKEIDAYNTWAKKIHSESTNYTSKIGTVVATFLPIVDEQDLIKFSETYNRMSLQQKNQSVEFPFPGFKAKENEQNFSLVQSPSVPKTPSPSKKSMEIIEVPMKEEVINGKTYQYYMENGKKKYFDQYGAADIVEVPASPPPPAPKSPLDHVIEMAKKGATFYYENKSISSDEAIQLLKKNDQLNISTKQSDSKNPKVYISKEPITIKDSTKRTGMIETESIPKPTAKNAVNHLKVMNRHNAKFYLDETEVSFADALKAVRKNKNADINTTTEPAIVQIESK